VCADVFLLCSAEVASTYMVRLNSPHATMTGCKDVRLLWFFFYLFYFGPRASRSLSCIQFSETGYAYFRDTGASTYKCAAWLKPRGPEGLATHKCRSVPTHRRIFLRKSFRLRGHQFCLKFSIATNTRRLVSKWRQSALTGSVQSASENLLDIVRKLREDEALLKSDNANLWITWRSWPASGIVVLQSRSAGRHRNRWPIYSGPSSESSQELSCSCNFWIGAYCSPSEESADRWFTLDAASAVTSPQVSAVQVHSHGFRTVSHKKETAAGASTVNTAKHRRQPLIGLRNSHFCQQAKSNVLFVSGFTPEFSADDVEKSLKRQLNLRKFVCTRLKTKFNNIHNFMFRSLRCISTHN
jgi:hypothetical protein